LQPASTSTQNQPLTFPPPITATRSQDLPGTFTPVKTDSDIAVRISEAKRLFYLPASFRPSKARHELFYRWSRECFIMGTPFVVICRKPGPLYGGYLSYGIGLHMIKDFNLPVLSRKLNGIYERLRNDRALWRTMPAGHRLNIGLTGGLIPFCDSELAPVKAAWEVLGAVIQGSGGGGDS